MTHICKFFFIAFILLSCACSTQKQYAYYSPKDNPYNDIEKALQKAANKNQQVLLQFGGNWCPLSRNLDRLLSEQETLKTLIDEHFILVHINHSVENPNQALLDTYAGNIDTIPFWVILRPSGEIASRHDLSPYQAFTSFQSADLKNILQQSILNMQNAAPQ